VEPSQNYVHPKSRVGLREAASAHDGGDDTVRESDILEVSYVNTRIEWGWFFRDSTAVVAAKVDRAGLYHRSGSAFKELKLWSLSVQDKSTQGSRHCVKNVGMP
jgi:hypothetical protein